MVGENMVNVESAAINLTHKIFGIICNVVRHAPHSIIGSMQAEIIAYQSSGKWFPNNLCG
jgi:hypothetical protein